MNIVTFLQNGFLFFVGFSIIMALLGAIIGLKSYRRQKGIDNLEAIHAKALIDQIKKAQAENNSAELNILCDQTVEYGRNIISRQRNRAFFKEFEKAGIYYPEHGRYSDEYGYCMLWVIIYQEWASLHPNETN